MVRVDDNDSKGGCEMQPNVTVRCCKAWIYPPPRSIQEHAVQESMTAIAMPTPLQDGKKKLIMQTPCHNPQERVRDLAIRVCVPQPWSISPTSTARCTLPHYFRAIGLVVHRK